jgi:hypothetical protein
VTFTPPFSAQPYGATVDTTTDSDTPKNVIVFPGEGPTQVLTPGAILQVRLVALASSDDGKRALYERVGLFVYPESGAGLTQVGSTVDVVTIEDDAAWNAVLFVPLFTSPRRLGVTITGAAAPVVTRWRLRMDVLMGRAF